VQQTFENPLDSGSSAFSYSPSPSQASGSGWTDAPSETGSGSGVQQTVENPLDSASSAFSDSSSLASGSDWTYASSGSDLTDASSESGQSISLERAVEMFEGNPQFEALREALKKGESAASRRGSSVGSAQSSGSDSGSDSTVGRDNTDWKPVNITYPLPGPPATGSGPSEKKFSWLDFAPLGSEGRSSGSDRSSGSGSTVGREETDWTDVKITQPGPSAAELGPSATPTFSGWTNYGPLKRIDPEGAGGGGETSSDSGLTSVRSARSARSAASSASSASGQDSASEQGSASSASSSGSSGSVATRTSSKQGMGEAFADEAGFG